MKLLLSWSSGKDSAWSLHVLRQDPSVQVVGLLTTINEVYDRVAMHAVRREVVEAQAAAAGLPLRIVPIPSPCSNEEYDARMREAVTRAVADGIEGIAFGDLFLRTCDSTARAALPARASRRASRSWGRPTDDLARAMIAGGLRARVTCLNPAKIDRALAGHEFDTALLARLPEGTDPCAERGEFHTCCYAGPMFDEPVPVVTGETVERDGYVFTDLVLRR